MGYNYVIVANNDKTRITNSDLPPQEFLDELFYYADGLVTYGIKPDHFLVYLDETETKQTFIPLYGTEEPDPVLFVDDHAYVKNKNRTLEAELKSQWMTIGSSALNFMKTLTTLPKTEVVPPWFPFIHAFIEHMRSTDPDLYQQYHLRYIADESRIKASCTTYYSTGAVDKLIARLKIKVGYAFYLQYGIDEALRMMAEYNVLHSE
ncbi:hypothetical protein [Sulfoacidibacillus ferrooxidans]|uniref:Uncharacterized protein n=1 Tax=Sulfoacidibacillus ferrooxidans TaxID=2005001 RepID=A0A9X1VAY1_9BACL|nr:hypothetical protein [Sulfoacidibacillus ferrooxidans]MCI0184936.1 hypothetical protein [Sulfoacidibacillus ferrooxidans]